MNQKETSHLLLKTGAYACFEFLNNFWRTWDYGDATTEAFCFGTQLISKRSSYQNAQVFDCSGAVSQQIQAITRTNPKKHWIITDLTFTWWVELHAICMFSVNDLDVQNTFWLISISSRCRARWMWLSVRYCAGCVSIHDTEELKGIWIHFRMKLYWETSECHSKISCKLTVVNESLMFLLKLSGKKKMASLIHIPHAESGTQSTPLCRKGAKMMTKVAILISSPWAQLPSRDVPKIPAGAHDWLLAELVSSAAELLINHDWAVQKMKSCWIELHFK